MPPKADIRQRIEHVCFVPEADISAARQLSPLMPSADIDGGRRLTRHANDTSSRVTYSHKLNPALFGDCFIRLVDHGDLLCRYEDELLRHATHHQLIWLVFGASRRYWLLSSSLLTDG
jgi:hypothetical protein